MKAEKPNVSSDARYSIKETCKILGIHRDTLYRYTHVTCEIKCGVVNRGGKIRKFYCGREILRFWSKHI